MVFVWEKTQKDNTKGNENEDSIINPNEESDPLEIFVRLLGMGLKHHGGGWDGLPPRRWASWNTAPS